MKRDPLKKAQEPSRSQAHLPGATSYPHFGSHKLRALAASGLGEAGAMQAEVERMMRTDAEAEDPRTRPTPHVVDLDGVTRGLGLEPADEQRVQRLVQDSPAAYSQKTQTPRLIHARGRLVSTMRDAMRHVPADTRDEVTRRAMSFWKRNNQTDYGRTPTVRFQGARDVTKSMTLVVPLGADLEKGEARGGKYLSRRPDGRGGWIYSYAESHGAGGERVKVPAKKESFEIATHDGKEAREGVQLGDYAMHREKGYGGMQYHITHKPSGMSAASSFSRVEAEAMLHHLGTTGGGHDGTNAGAKGVMSAKDRFSHDFSDVKDASKHRHHDYDGPGGKKWSWASEDKRAKAGDGLEKAQARGGKYFKRIPTGNPKHPWRYFYHEAEYQAWLREKHVGGAEASERRVGQLGFDFSSPAPAAPERQPAAPAREPSTDAVGEHRHVEPAIIPVWAEMAKRAADDALARADAHLVHGMLARMPPLLEGLGPGKARSWLEEHVMKPLRAAAAAHDAAKPGIPDSEAKRPAPAQHGLEVTGAAHVAASTGVDAPAPARAEPHGGFKTEAGTKGRAIEHAEKLAALIRQHGVERAKVWTKEGKSVRVYLPGNQYLSVGQDGTVATTEGGRQVFDPGALWPKHAKAVADARAKHREWHQGGLVEENKKLAADDPFAEFEEHERAKAAAKAPDPVTPPPAAETPRREEGWVGSPKQIGFAKTFLDQHKKRIADARALVEHGDYDPEIRHAALSALEGAAEVAGNVRNARAAIEARSDWSALRRGIERYERRKMGAEEREKWDAAAATLDSLSAQLVWIARLRKEDYTAEGTRFIHSTSPMLSTTIPPSMIGGLKALGLWRPGRTPAVPIDPKVATPKRVRESVEESSEPVRVRPALGQSKLEEALRGPKPPKVTPKGTLSMEAVNALPVGAVIVTKDGTTAWRKVADGKMGWERQKPSAVSPDGWERMPDADMHKFRAFSAIVRETTADGVKLQEKPAVTEAAKAAAREAGDAADLASAHAFSERAGALPAEAHRRLADKHRDAAEKFRAIGNEPRVARHEEAAADHEQEAKKIDARQPAPAPPAPKPTLMDRPPPGGWSDKDKVPQEYQDRAEEMRQKLRAAAEAAKADHARVKEHLANHRLEQGQTVTVDGAPYRVRWGEKDIAGGKYGRSAYLTPLAGRARNDRELIIRANGAVELHTTGAKREVTPVRSFEGGTKRDKPWAPPEVEAPKPTPAPVVPTPQPAPAGTPRGDANAEAKKAEAEGEFVNDRASAIEQRGEDVKNSARHKALVWKSLRDASGSAQAEQLFTRDFLEKQEPVQFVAAAQKLVNEGTPRRALQVLLGHYMLRKFPARPSIPPYRPDDQGARFPGTKYDGKRLVSYSRDEAGTGAHVSREEHTRLQREGYYAAWTEASKLIEAFIAEPPDSSGNPRNDVSRFLNGTAALHKRMNEEYGYGSSAAEAIRDLHNAIGGRGALSPLGLANEFAKRMAAKYPAVEDRAANLATHVMRVLEGKSLNEAFDQKQTKGADPWDLTNVYNTSKMERKGPASEYKGVKQGLDLLDKRAGGKYGMRGVQWGKSVTDAEREHHLKSIVDSFADLTRVLGLPPGMASFNGRLALAVGARGKGTASAHYESDSRVINLTRESGAGALAHEWGHMFDHLLHEAAGQPAAASGRARFASETGGVQWTPQGRQMPEEETFGKVTSLMESEAMLAFRNRLDDVLRGAVRGKTMSAGKSDYWRSTREVFARCFERFVQRKLHAAGQENTYLSGLATSGGRVGALWPTDAETDAMTPHFEAIFEAFAKSDHLHKAFARLLDRPLIDPRYQHLVGNRLIIPR